MTKKKKMSTIDFIVYFIVKVKKDDIFALASQLAYYLVLSFFPFVIFLITLVGFSQLSSMDVLNAFQNFLPESAFELTASIVTEVVGKQNSGLLGVSVFLTIWSASSAFKAVIKGINKAYYIKETRSYIKRSLIAIICTLALAVTILSTLAMLVFGGVIGDYLKTVLPFENIIMFLWDVMRYVIVVVMMVLVFASIYKFIPAKKIKFREVIPGAVFSTIGWIVVSSVFSFYINNFSNYSRIYGSLGAMFALMTWLFITSMILMLGIEINCVLSNHGDEDIS